MVKFELVKSFLDLFYAGFQLNCDLISLAILLQCSDIVMYDEFCSCYIGIILESGIHWQLVQTKL